MKRTLLLIAVALFVSSTAFSQFKFGAGVTAGTKAGIDVDGTKINFGLNARAVYNLSDDLAIQGGFTYYLPNKYTVDPNETKFTLFYFNADAMYYLMNEDTKVYALGGLNWASFTTKLNGVKVDLLSDTGFSWEVGGGAEFGNIFVEAKYDGNMEQIVGTVGYYF